jgi:AcrR family transcriptional regulator
MTIETQEISRREQKKRETKKRLLLAAWDHFRAKGFDETTVEEITETAQVAKGTFFNYFSSKEEVLAALATWGLDQIRRRIDPGEGGPASPVSRIKMLLGEIGAAMAENGALGRRMLVAYWHRHRQLDDMEVSLWHLVFSLVEEAQQAGEMRRDVRADFVTKLLLASCIFDRNRENLSRAEIEQNIDYLLEGFAGSKGRSA